VDSITTLLLSIGLVFTAEIGDKTMISTIILALQTGRFIQVVGASILGFTLANIIAVVVGFIARSMVDLSILKILAGILFIGVGFWMIMGKEEEEEKTSLYGVLAAFLTVFLMEMGDKTQITVFTLSMLYDNPLIVLIGGVLGYGVANISGLLVAKYIEGRVDWLKIKKYAGLVMVFIGVVVVVEYILGY
jgi:putative Ca2+/H+ antiporter (TMEM165/GDT1 family)